MRNFNNSQLSPGFCPILKTFEIYEISKVKYENVATTNVTTPKPNTLQMQESIALYHSKTDKQKPKTSPP